MTRPLARDYLRAATGRLHAELDGRMAPLFKQGDSGYTRFLTSSARALWPIERALTDAGVSTLLPDWPRRSRSDALLLDLSALALPEPDTLRIQPIRGPAFMFGMLYVLEGSRLGARVLLREVSDCLNPAAQAATRYLAHGQGMHLWSTFLAQLEASRHVRDNPRLAASGACTAFELFLETSAGDGVKGVAGARGQ